VLSIIINQPPQYFKAWNRLAGFFLILLVMSPIFISDMLFELRRKLLFSILNIGALFSVGSFICYFLDINFFERNNEILSIEAGHFSGLFRHSMLLGPIAGLSAIYTFVLYLKSRKRSFLLLIVILCCIGSNLLSASRGAVGACILGMVVAFMCFFKGNMSHALVIGLIVLGVLAATYPLWGNMTDFLLSKQEIRMDAGGAFMSREDLWHTRFIEIRQHPIIGVGFCCVDSGLTFVDTQTGVIEPGSSWLAVFSMTGIFGFLTFLLMFILSFRHAFLLNDRSGSCLLCGLLSFFALHFVLEGYVLAAGSFIGLFFWLLLGCVWGNRNNRQIN
jgi:hypothetical protein